MSVVQTDVVPLVQALETKRIKLSTLFNTVVNLTMSGIFKINGIEATAAAGIITLTEYLSTLTNISGAPAAFTLAPGAPGQFKLLSVTAANAALNVAVTGGNGFTSIQFSAVGKSCLLYYTNKWHIVSNNGGVTS